MSYSQIAFEKELARCNLIVDKNNIQKGKEKDENIKRIISGRLNPNFNEQYIKEAKCPCCDNKTMFMVGILLGLTQINLEMKPRQSVGFKLFMFRIH